MEWITHATFSARIVYDINGQGGVHLAGCQIFCAVVRIYISIYRCDRRLGYIEGYKIATTEYYGLRNLGFVLVIIPILLSSLVYPVIVLPLSWLIGSMLWVRDSLLLYALLYAVMWAGVGVPVLRML